MVCQAAKQGLSAKLTCSLAMYTKELQWSWMPKNHLASLQTSSVVQYPLAFHSV